jgi:hypothetical protein
MRLVVVLLPVAVLACERTTPRPVVESTPSVQAPTVPGAQTPTEPGAQTPTDPVAKPQVAPAVQAPVARKTTSSPAVTPLAKSTTAPITTAPRTAHSGPATPSRRPPVYHYPEGAIGPAPVRKKPDCDISLVTFQLQDAGGRLKIVAGAINNTASPILVTVQDRCPAGAIQFTGLPAGYDYYGTCNKGACPGNRPPITWSLPPDKQVDLATFVLDPAGGTCNAPLPGGTYDVSFKLAAGDSTTCGPFATRVVRTVAPISAPPAPPQRAPKRQHPCPPMPTCGIGCSGPPARDVNGCPTCGCQDLPSIN